MPATRPLHTLTSALVAAGLLTGCAAAPTSPPDGGRPQVLASFYPLQFVADRVGGEHADVGSLTLPGRTRTASSCRRGRSGTSATPTSS
ncbi:hypothetical protein [Cellulomonas sp. ATA003]|uniref:hypothetical protein n=1 Tax=Cellulomonas sp. ATA003 TaxID=3073064 RepID=UPI002872CF34|nr:hypothetical protein [Cellulomonas sp. ATA003]WNB85850.1 hypothetical protein REH70_00440 [Cellulomonas sp. ATA003]